MDYNTAALAQYEARQDELERAGEATDQRRALHTQDLFRNHASLTKAVAAYLADCNGTDEAAQIVVSVLERRPTTATLELARQLCGKAAEYDAQNQIADLSPQDLKDEADRGDA